MESDTNARQWIGQNLTHGQCKPQCMLTLSRHMFVCVGMGESCDCLLTGLIKNGHTRTAFYPLLPHLSPISGVSRLTYFNF